MKTMIVHVALLAALVVMFGGIGSAWAQELKNQTAGHPIDGAVIYDYDPKTSLGDDVFGTIIADLEKDAPGRNSHGGPVCMEYANGDLVAFYANTSDHNLDGWSECAVSKDGGRTWSRYNKFPYSHEAYKKDRKAPVWIEEGLVTSKGTVVLFVTQFERWGKREKSGFLTSRDNGSTWSDCKPVDGAFAGYPCAVAVEGDTNYVLFDDRNMSRGPHVLYASTDDGRTWRRRSTLPLDKGKWYGAMCIMADGALLAGAYASNDEHHFYYTISRDKGKTWAEQKRSYVDKKVRDPELAYLGGRYYLHGRSGGKGEGSHRFVLYQSTDGVHWKNGIVVSKDARPGDGYSHNCIVHKYDKDVPNEVMVQYSITYKGRDTNEYVFFIRPRKEDAR